MRLITGFIFLLLCSFQSFAQVQEDSSVRNAIADTAARQKPLHKDTIVKALVSPAQVYTDTAGNAVDTAAKSLPSIDSSWKKILTALQGKSFAEWVYATHPFFSFTSPPIIAGSDIKQFQGKEVIFYTLIGLLLLFALLKLVFAKYVNDLFRLFFRRTLKQRQITEQLSQTPLPSLIFNSFFVIIGGLYLAFVLQHYGMENQQNFWLLTAYSCAGLSIMYLLKYLSLKFTGWVLNLSTATDAYIFIVFIINKVIGIFLLPFVILLAFTENDIFQVAFTCPGAALPVWLFTDTFYLILQCIIRSESSHSIF